MRKSVIESTSAGVATSGCEETLPKRSSEKPMLTSVHGVPLDQLGHPRWYLHDHIRPTAHGTVARLEAAAAANDGHARCLRSRAASANLEAPSQSLRSPRSPRWSRTRYSSGSSATGSPARLVTSVTAS